jgi:hypothetical protein
MKVNPSRLIAAKTNVVVLPQFMINSLTNKPTVPMNTNNGANLYTLLNSNLTFQVD